MIYSNLKAALKPGSTHSDVYTLQQLLSQRSSPIPLTGRFDYETEIAVKNFQMRMFLEPDGVVDPPTWQALYTGMPASRPSLRRGDCGPAVAALQEVLSIDGYYTGAIDGGFGRLTHLAVQRLQADYSLLADGIVSPETWWALSEI